VKSALGRFRIVAELGRGSTSIVYLGALSGRHGVSKLFALKQLRPAMAEDADKVSLFVAEARLGARLSHPNVVQTLEIEEDGPLPFIVMEYLDGQPLQRVVTTARAAFTPLPLHMHLAVVSGAIEGLGYAHAALGPDGAAMRVVHRDVSPYNVLLTVSGQPKLLDFGIAQTIEAPGAISASAGRAAYMSPELAAGDPVDLRADLFSVGVMLWEAATRRRFWGDTMSKEEIQGALACRRLPEARVAWAGRAPPELQGIIVKATSPDPADRYGSAGEIQADLQLAMRALAPTTFAQREMGLRVAALFATDRARLQTAIDEDFVAAQSIPPSERPSLTPPPPQARESRPEPTPRSPVTGERRPEPPPQSSQASSQVRESHIEPAPITPPRVEPRATPLPRYPDPVVEPTGGRLERRPVAVAVATIAIVASVAAAWWLRGHDPAVRAAATAAMPSAEAVTVGPRPEPEPSAVREVPPPTVDVAPALAESGAASAVSGPAALAPRPRAARPAHVPASAPSAPTLATEASTAVATPAPVAAAAPSGARPSRPIDSNNPYGP
jgi:serine/threonine-protein kinase